MINEWNFFKGSESDKDLFFGPLDGEEFCSIGSDWTMANIVSMIGIFPSVTQARRNGWFKPIPEGFTDMRIGKAKTRVTIFNDKN